MFANIFPIKKYLFRGTRNACVRIIKIVWWKRGYHSYLSVVRVIINVIQQDTGLSEFDAMNVDAKTKEIPYLNLKTAWTLLLGVSMCYVNVGPTRELKTNFINI